MKYLALVALFGTVGLAQEAVKPRCNARNQGSFWPPEANASQYAARQLFQQGELEMCSLAVWKYKWQRLSVNVHDATPAKRRPTDAKTGASAASPSR